MTSHKNYRFLLAFFKKDLEDKTVTPKVDTDLCGVFIYMRKLVFQTREEEMYCSIKHIGQVNYPFGEK